MIRKPKGRNWDLPVVFTIYLALAIAASYPTIFNLTRGIYGYPGDSTGTIWSFWWLKYVFSHHISGNFTSFIAAPFGVDLSTVPQLPMMTYPALLLSYLFGEVAAYNILSILSFPLAGLGCYLLARHYVGDKVIAAVAGLVFAFAPYHFAHSQGHLGISMSYAWIPWVFLAMILLYERPGIWRALALGVLYAVMTLTNYYDAFFILVPMAVFVVYTAVKSYQKNKRAWIKDGARFMFFLAAAFTASAAIILPFMANIFTKISGSPGFYAKSFEELKVFTARPWEYFIPSAYNPFFSKPVTSFLMSHLHGSNVVEMTIFLGYTPMILAAIAGYVYFTRRKSVENEKLKFAAGFFILAGLASALASAPPYIPVAGFKIPLFSYFAYKIVPMFRVYSRFGAQVMICTSVLAAVGLQHILKRWPGNRKRIAIVAGIVLLIMIEFITIPPLRFTDMPVPSEYAWLKTRPGNMIVAEYPLFNSDNAGHYSYLYYQRIHKKRLVNGTVKNTRADGYRQLMEDIENPATPAILSRLGVQYVLVHWDRYGKSKPDRVAKGLQLVRVFGDRTSVYKVAARPADLVVINLSGFDALLKAYGKNDWLGMNGEAQIEIDNYTGKNRTVALSFAAVSFQESRKLTFLQDGKTVWSRNISTIPESFVIDRLFVKPGRNIFILSTPHDSEAANNVLEDEETSMKNIRLRELQIL